MNRRGFATQIRFLSRLEQKGDTATRPQWVLAAVILCVVVEGTQQVLNTLKDTVTANFVGVAR